MRIAKRSFEIAHQPRLAHATHANEQGSIATGPVSTTASRRTRASRTYETKTIRKAHESHRTQRKRHDHPQLAVRTHRQHPARQTQPRDRRHQSHHRGEGRIPEPGRLVQGPHRRTHHRRGRTQRRTEARRRDRGTDLRQHRRRTRARGFAARIPCDLHPAGQGFRSQACGAARIRRRSGRNPPPTPARTTRAPTTRWRTASPRRFPAATVPTSTTIRTVPKATNTPLVRKSGRPPTTRSRISWRASAPAAPSPAPDTI